MFNFLIQKRSVRAAQKYIDQLEPKVTIHLPEEIPLPSLREIKKMAHIVAEINGMEQKIAGLTDDQLKAKTAEFKDKYAKAVSKDKDAWLAIQEQVRSAVDPTEKEELTIKLEQTKEKYNSTKQQFLKEILPEAFAVCRETGKRVLNMRHYDVQMIGGMVLNGGNIAEMTTGEGKTLVATLATYLNALTGDGVHVVTVNDYLAKRDQEWMGPLYEFHGLTVGVILHDMIPRERHQAYAADVTYGTNNEFGFDYLRDNMVSSAEEMVQRPHHFAVVDEVDSILVDEARTPLIISGPAEMSTDKYYKAYDVSLNLKGRRITEKDEVDAKHQEVDLGEGFDYLADEKAKSVSLTEQGELAAAKLFGIDNLHDMETIEYRHHILQALKAKEFFKRDVDYVVKDGQVIIVDEFTGRMMPGRRWSDGLHQAVEAGEGIKIERENQTLATITFQNYFRLYDKLSGMTGTAYTEATEFEQIYKLEVVVVPTNRPLQRKNFPDAIYKSTREKYIAVVDEIVECHKQGQPVLVGTISIEKSELVAAMLKQKGVPHKVLNAKFHENEANIIAQAGRKSGVTIATNMAGRGTDIVLGGNAEFLAQNLVEQKNQDMEEEKKQELAEKFIKEFREQCKQEQQEVKVLGGLHVIGTERHESRRIDNQLRGRQGRQGDPGSSRFFVSLEDDLMRLFASDRIVNVMEKLGMEEGQVLEHPWLSKALENAQRRVEGHNFEIRKHLLEYDDVMNRQREVIYSLRKQVLESTNIKPLIQLAIEDTLDYAIARHIIEEPNVQMENDWEGLEVYLKAKFNYDISDRKEEWKKSETTNLQIFDAISKDVLAAYELKEQEIGVEQLRYIERMLMLNTIDAKWKDHLYAMDQMKEGINLRAFAQKDPLVEYKKEGFSMFQFMYNTINQEVAEIIFKIQLRHPEEGGPTGREPKPRGVFSAIPKRLVHNEVSGYDDAAAKSGMSGASQDKPKSAPIRHDGPKTGRNDPCPCGSGKKFKKCCGQ